MAEIDVMFTLTAVLFFVLFAWLCNLSFRAAHHQQELRNRPPRDELADINDFIRRLGAVTTDEELDKLEQERKGKWHNSSSPLSSG